jgi:[acyl-carrier-protein] S-malonyltransferase
MSNIVLLFSGQGAQKVGMGKDWVETSATAREMAVQADKALGYSVSHIMFEGPDEDLTMTSHCQPALYLHGLMALALIRERVPNFVPVAAAGLSLGEFTAHAAAGSFSFEDGLRLVARRGEFMEQACQATEGAMAALIGGDEENVRALAAAAKDFGIRRAIKLNVAGAYHSRLMQSAQDQLAAELANVNLQSPSMPVVSNFGASVVSAPAEIRNMLEKQVTGSVRWTESIQALIAMGHRTFLELGPGKVIAGLVSKIDKETTVHSVEDLASLEAAVEALS